MSNTKPGTHPNSIANLTAGGTTESALKAWVTRRDRHGDNGCAKQFEGRYTTEAGYVFVKRPSHPNADRRGYVREHVLVMSTQLGRPIRDREVVHHKNGIRGDNRAGNLEVMDRGDHHSHHHKGVSKPGSVAALRAANAAMVAQRRAARTYVCAGCGRSYVARTVAKHERTFCAKKCYGAFLRRAH